MIYGFVQVDSGSLWVLTKVNEYLVAHESPENGTWQPQKLTFWWCCPGTFRYVLRYPHISPAEFVVSESPNALSAKNRSRRCLKLEVPEHGGNTTNIALAPDLLVLTYWIAGRHT